MMALVLALSFDRGSGATPLKTRLPADHGRWSYAVYIGQTVWLLPSASSSNGFIRRPMTIVLGSPSPACLVAGAALPGAGLRLLGRVSGGLRRTSGRIAALEAPAWPALTAQSATPS